MIDLKATISIYGHVILLATALFGISMVTASKDHHRSGPDPGESIFVPGEREEDAENGSIADGHERYHIASFDWHHVEGPMIVTLWLLFASLAKIVFHMSTKFASVFPDSSLLIVLGLILGIILNFFNIDKEKFILPSEIFFLFLLPPIVFDAGYFMPSRAFFDNLGTILVYAVIGTIWNTLAIGFSLYGIGLTGLFRVETPLLHVLVFTSLISAVDPVAVLVVFEEIHVNELLYITVFGESLLNDAVTVVLYRMFEAFSIIGAPNVLPIDVVAGLVSFLVVALGGVLVGILSAIAVSAVTRLTKKVRVLEPLFIFAFAYASYLASEMFHLSGILAIVFCGICMKQYVKANMSQKSQTTVKYFLKMLSSGCETIIFMFLGLSTISSAHVWDTAFVCLTILFCLLYRAIGTLVLTYFVNKKRLAQLNKVEQFIMAYGGLRGAVAYGLVVALNESVVPAKGMFVTATIAVVYFTVFFQGMTIKPLVNLLKVKKDEKRETTMNEQIFDRVCDHLMSGLEDLTGHYGHHWLRDKWEHYNKRWLKPVLMRKAAHSTGHSIMSTFTKLNMKDALSYLNQYGSFYNSGTNESISKLIRDQSTHKLAPVDGDGGLTLSVPRIEVAGGGGSTILDMHAIDGSSGTKLDVDAKYHHIVPAEHGLRPPVSAFPTLEVLEGIVEARHKAAHGVHYADDESDEEIEMPDLFAKRRYSRQMVADEPSIAITRSTNANIKQLMHERGRQKAETARRLSIGFARRASLDSAGSGSDAGTASSRRSTAQRAGSVFVGAGVGPPGNSETDGAHPMSKRIVKVHKADAPPGGAYAPSEENLEYITFTVPTIPELASRRHSGILDSRSATPSSFGGGSPAPPIYTQMKPRISRCHATQTGSSLTDLHRLLDGQDGTHEGPTPAHSRSSSADLDSQEGPPRQANVADADHVNEGLLLPSSEENLTAAERAFPWKSTTKTPTSVKKGLLTEPLSTDRELSDALGKHVLTGIGEEEEDQTESTPSPTSVDRPTLPEAMSPPGSRAATERPGATAAAHQRRQGPLARAGLAGFPKVVEDPPGVTISNGKSRSDAPQNQTETSRL